MKEFQSHAGSIEAGPAELARYLTYGGFNPTLVRLRLFFGASYSALYLSFNPTLVRLRLRDYIYAETPGTGFNPTLVRLRPPAEAPSG